MAEITVTSEITVEWIDRMQMGSDAMLAAAAWVSKAAKAALERARLKPDDVEGVIRYLIKHRHGTPFEHGAITMYVHAPIFVWREWHRHRIGFCMAGDTQVWTDRAATEKCGRVVRKLILKDLCERWNHGVSDSIGRVRHLPSVKQQTLRVLNEETHLFERGRIEDVFESGIKEMYSVRTRDHRGFSIRCSKDHRVLTPEGWARVEELSPTDCIYVSGKRNALEVSVPPSLRRGIGVWTSMQRGKLIRPLDFCRRCGEKFPRELLVLDHKVPVVTDLTRALDKTNLQPYCEKCHRFKTNDEQKMSERQIVAGSKLVRLRGKPQRVSEEMSYDIAMEGPHHNFVANGIVVHNSYNEESARYKVLEPVFYLPPRDRPMFKVVDWKPGRPKFLPIAGPTGESAYGRLCRNLTESYKLAYEKYQDNLAMGIDPGLARDCLPVGVYSSCWVTCNPRSLMAFLSLRTHEPTANHVSYPLYEIEVAARKVEKLLERFWPVTCKAFRDNGREGP